MSIVTLAIGQVTSNWTISTGYAVKFTTKKATGTFENLQGTIQFDPSNPTTAKFDVWVETATISTGNKTKDKHARGSKWLDAEQHPRISFKSSEFEKIESGYEVKGQLNIHGVTKEVSIPFAFNDQVFSGNLTINRIDYGIEGPFLFGGLVGDEIAIALQVPVTKK
jgi:polyisoprenoid-binding protein YceI